LIGGAKPGPEAAITVLQAGVAIRDPHDCTDSADTLALTEAVFDALVRRGRDGRFLPALAERWSLSGDARTWTFELRAGVRFHDGTALNARSMLCSVERMQRPDVGATLGAPAVWAQYLANAKLDAPDERTLRITTTEPSAYLLDILVSAYAVPPKLVDRDDFTQSPVGTGAYRVERIDQGCEAILRTNPAWYGERPANDTLRLLAIADEEERIHQLLHRGAHAVSRVHPAQAEPLAVEGSFTGVEHIDPTAIIYLLNASRGPFSDRRIRRALNLAVDRLALVDTVLGGAGRPLTGVVSPAHIGANPAWPEDEYSPVLARDLLAEAGRADGLELVVDCPTRLPDEAQRLTAELSRQLAKVGIRLDVRLTEDRTRYAENVRDKHIQDMALFDSSPISTYRLLIEKIDSRVRGSWWQGYRNEGAERLVDRIASTIDDAARADLLREACDILREDPPWLTLYNHKRCTVLRGRHTDWTIRPDGVLDLAGLPALAD
jgi:peptide/nickel transport system substrate-binding protein